MHPPTLLFSLDPFRKELFVLRPSLFLCYPVCFPSLIPSKLSFSDLAFKPNDFPPPDMTLYSEIIIIFSIAPKEVRAKYFVVSRRYVCDFYVFSVLQLMLYRLKKAVTIKHYPSLLSGQSGHVEHAG